MKTRERERESFMRDMQRVTEARAAKRDSLSMRIIKKLRER